MIPNISIVVCTYNSMQMLSDAIKCLIYQESSGKFTFDIIVVDDGSTDQTGETVTNAANTAKVPISYIRTQGKGISHARNIGIAESKGDWIAFFDQDQLTETNWVRELFNVASETGAYVVDGPRELALSEEKLSELSYVCRRILGELKGGSEQHRSIGRTCSCTGNVLINRDVFDVVGGFDESIIQGGEDWDYFRRVRKAKFDIWYAPKALVKHVIPPERLTEKYFKFSSLRHGSNFATRDYKEWGLFKTILVWFLRIGQALLINIPFLILAYTIRDHKNVMSCKCLLLRAIGYSRKSLFLLLPRLFSQKRFFQSITIRREQKTDIISENPSY